MNNDSRRELIRPLLIGVALAVTLGASTANAQNAVFHSPNDDGVNPGTPFSLPAGPGESLYLYLDTGSALSQTGTPCADGDGREICGYEITVEALGSAFFVDFIPESTAIANLTPTQARINGLFSLEPAQGAVRIGELKAASSDTDGAVMISGGKVVLAALQIENVPQQMVVPVPEPLTSLSLIAGAVVLVGLGRYRRWRSHDRERPSQAL